MKILLNKSDLNEALYNISSLGFVPTMGSLHEGHISLIKKSLKECKKTIVSIFVNPKQFNNKVDYNKYPKNNKRDLIILRKLKVNFVYLPNNKDVFSIKRDFFIKLNNNEKILCAKYRKGHFEGVLDVMDRLTKMINPNKIYMGEKDLQQLYLVKKYIEKNYKSKIISCETIRSENKLALSSRNLHLRKIDKIKAGIIAREILIFKKNISKSKNIFKLLKAKKKELEKQYKINIEYFELRNRINLKISQKLKNSKIFLAYYLNNIRLIDNF